VANRPTSLGDRLMGNAEDLWRMARMGTSNGLAPDHLDLIAGTYDAAALAYRLSGHHAQAQSATDSAASTRGAAGRQRARLVAQDAA